MSLWLLLRGHNEPGGGFSGGLIGAIALVVYMFGFGPEATRRVLSVRPMTMIGLGMFFATISGLLAFFLGAPYLKAYWTVLPPWNPDGYKLGTPLLFDIGVYLVVVGTMLNIILLLDEERKE